MSTEDTDIDFQQLLGSLEEAQEMERAVEAEQDHQQFVSFLATRNMKSPFKGLVRSCMIVAAHQRRSRAA